MGGKAMLSEMYIWKPRSLTLTALCWLVGAILAMFAAVNTLGTVFVLAVTIWIILRDPNGAHVMRGVVNWTALDTALANVAPFYRVGLRVVFWGFFPILIPLYLFLAAKQRTAQRAIWRETVQRHIDALEQEAANFHNPVLNDTEWTQREKGQAK